MHPSGQTVADLGEQALLRRLVRGLPARPDVAAGPGDDCAVVCPAGAGRWDWLLKSDPFIEGVHFTAATPAAAVGHRALARVLSDVAAMGGEPLWVLVNIVAPASLPARRLARVYAGLARLARRRTVAVAGGDLARGPRLELHVFAVGRAPRAQAIRRSGGRPGDRLFVTGALGGGDRALAFTPRLAEGRWLRRGRWATAMIDLSDGLAVDLAHLARASGLGAVVRLEALPLAPAAARLPRAARWRRACGAGEDYELLFAVPAARAAALQAAWPASLAPCRCIGELVPGRGRLTWLDGRGRPVCLAAAGYEHFRS